MHAAVGLACEMTCIREKCGNRCDDFEVHLRVLLVHGGLPRPCTGSLEAAHETLVDERPR